MAWCFLSHIIIVLEKNEIKNLEQFPVHHQHLYE